MMAIFLAMSSRKLESRKGPDLFRR